MKHNWVVFFWNNTELLRYSLAGEYEGEREATIGLLAYEYDIPAEEIECEVRWG